MKKSAIDANLMSEGYEYFRVGTIEISPDNKTMAYSIDTVSRRIYTIYFMDLETREIIEKIFQIRRVLLPGQMIIKPFFITQKI